MPKASVRNTVGRFLEEHGAPVLFLELRAEVLFLELRVEPEANLFFELRAEPRTDDRFDKRGDSPSGSLNAPPR